MTGTSTAQMRVVELPYRSRRSSCERVHSSDDEAVVLRAVAAAKRGDREAVRYLYIRFADAVHRRVALLLHDEHEAEDVTQQVFTKLCTAIGQYEQRAMPFRAWLFRVARNVALDTMRARRCVPAPDVELAPRETSPAGSSMSALREALRALPVDQRNVVYLRHVLGLTPAEIAQRIGRSESAVHGLHHRGRQAIRHELEELHAAPAILHQAAVS
jgi:RNA polymerase sigma-70 factor, ECF subfamily